MSIVQIIEIGLGIVMIILSFMAIESKKILNSIIFLSILSLLIVVSFVMLQALDVAVTEAVIGSGLVTTLFLFTIQGINNLEEREW